MNVTEVLDIETTEGNSNSIALKAGDKITVQGFSTKYVEGVGSDIAEISTTEGLRHSFGTVSYTHLTLPTIYSV